jgi:hypothetical protein
MLYNDFDMYPIFTMFILEYFWVSDFYHGYIGGTSWASGSACTLNFLLFLLSQQELKIIPISISIYFCDT